MLGFCPIVEPLTVKLTEASEACCALDFALGSFVMSLSCQHALGVF